MSTSNYVGQTSKSFRVDPRDHVAALFWGGILAGLLPFLVKYCRAMWYQDLYQYFPFLLLGVFGLAYHRFDGRIRLPENLFSKAATLVAMVLMVLAAFLASSWLGAVSFVVATAGFLASQRESHVANTSGAAVSGRPAKTKGPDAATGALSLFYLAIPMVMFIRAPLLGTYTIMYRLQRATSSLGSTILDVLGIIHFQVGNTIELVNKSLFVAEACSGVQSLFTMCFLTLLLWAYRRRTFLVLPFYVAFAFFFAVVGNAIRVTSIAIGEAWFAIDLTHGLPHELVGYAALAIAAGMMASLDYVLGLLPWMNRIVVLSNAKRQVPKLGDAPEEITNTADASFDFFATIKKLPVHSLMTIAVFLFSGLVMIGWMLLQPKDVRPVVARDQVLFEPKASFFSELDVPIRVVNHTARRDAHADRNARHGMNSDGWQCGIPTSAGRPIQGQFLLSQPYMGWHELTVCYRNKEWSLASRTPIVPTSGSDPVVVAEFIAGEEVPQGSGKYGTLFFTAVDSDGSIPRAPGHTSISRSLAPLEPLIFDDFAELTGSAQTIMLQYWVTGDQPISSEEKQQVIDTIDQIREYTSKQVADYTQGLLEG